jgi:hypothetical protein
MVYRPHGLPDADVAQWMSLLLGHGLDERAADAVRVRWLWLWRLTMIACESDDCARELGALEDFPQLWISLLADPDDHRLLYEEAIDSLDTLCEQAHEIIAPLVFDNLSHGNPCVSSAFLRVVDAAEALEIALECSASESARIRENGLSWMVRAIGGEWLNADQRAQIGEWLAHALCSGCTAFLDVFEEWCRCAPAGLSAAAQPFVAALLQAQPSPAVMRCAAWLCQRPGDADLARRILAAVVEMCDDDAKGFLPPLWILVRAVGAEEALAILEERAELFFGDPECVLSPHFHTALVHLRPHAARRAPQIRALLAALIARDDRCFAAVRFYAGEFGFDVDTARFWAGHCAAGLGRVNTAECLLAICRQSAGDAQLFEFALEAVINALQAHTDIAVLGVLARNLEALAQGPDATEGHISRLVAQFVPLFAHFAQSCAAADPSWVEQDELEEAAESFGLVFDALFARRPAEMTAIAAEFASAELPLCLRPFLATVWADAVAWPEADADVDRPALIAGIHAALRETECVLAHRTLAQYYATRPEVAPDVIAEFLEIMCEENGARGHMRVLSALVVLARSDCDSEGFEHWLEIVLDRIARVSRSLQDDRPGCRRALNQIMPRCTRSLAARVEAAIEGLCEE